MRTTALAILCALTAAAQIMVVPPPVTANPTVTCSEVAMHSAAARTGMTFVTTDTAITGVIFRVGAVTTGGDVAVRLYGVDSNGLPTGTPTDLATVSVSAEHTFYTATWSPQAVAPGTMYALMLEFASYSGQNFNAQSCGGLHAPFGQVYYDGSTWAYNGVMYWILGSNGHVLPETAYMPTPRALLDFASYSSPNERGIACTFPFAMRVFAVRYFSFSGSTGPAAVNVYRNESLIASSEAIFPASGYGYASAPMDVLVEPGVPYIVAVKPQSTTPTAFLVWHLWWPGFPMSYMDVSRLFGQQFCQAAYRTGSNPWVYDGISLHPIQLLTVPGGM